MRRALVNLSVAVSVAAVAVVLAAGPALAQEAGESNRPWHYWIAPFLLGGSVIVIAALGVGYYVRVMGGRQRR